MSRMVTIVDGSLHGTTLFVEARDDQGRISRYALDWTTMQQAGQSGVLSAMASTGATPGQPVPAWVQQLVGQVVSV